MSSCCSSAVNQPACCTQKGQAQPLLGVAPGIEWQLIKHLHPFSITPCHARTSLQSYSMPCKNCSHPSVCCNWHFAAGSADHQGVWSRVSFPSLLHQPPLTQRQLVVCLPGLIPLDRVPTGLDRHSDTHDGCAAGHSAQAPCKPGWLGHQHTPMGCFSSRVFRRHTVCTCIGRCSA